MAALRAILQSPGIITVRSQKKTKTTKPPGRASKKSRMSPKAKNGASAIPLSLHRAVEDRFIAEHPEALEPFVNQWVVLEGTSIIAHGPDAAVVVARARDAGVKVPLIFWVEPKLKANQGRLGL